MEELRVQVPRVPETGRTIKAKAENGKKSPFF